MHLYSFICSPTITPAFKKRFERFLTFSPKVSPPKFCFDAQKFPGLVIMLIKSMGGDRQKSVIISAHVSVAKCRRSKLVKS